MGPADRSDRWARHMNAICTERPTAALIPFIWGTCGSIGVTPCAVTGSQHRVRHTPPASVSASRPASALDDEKAC